MNTLKNQLLGLALIGMILGGCSQTATYEDADLTNELAAAEKAGFKLNPFNVGGNENAALADCNDCITEAQVATQIISKVTGPPQSPTVTPYAEYSVYNTPTNIVLEFHFYGTSGADGMATNINGTIYSWSKDGNKDAAYTDVTLAGNGKILSFKITQALGVKDACTVYPTSVSYSGGDGGNLSGSLAYSIYEYCTEECDEESFSYIATVAEKDDVANILFTYDAAEPLEDAEVKFTFPQIQNLALNEDGKYEAPDKKEYSVNNSGNQTVLTWTGNIGCTDATATTFEFEVKAECNASGKAQIWTDTKVNGVSVKNENTKIIRFWCATDTIEETNED